MRLAIGDFYRRIGRTDEALSHYRTGRQTTTQRASISAYLKRIGATNFVLGKFDEALKDAQGAVANDSNDLDAVLLQSRIMIASGKPELVSRPSACCRHRRRRIPKMRKFDFSLVPRTSSVSSGLKLAMN